MSVKIPAQGVGDTTPLVATDKIGGVDYQQIKIVDGTVGGTQPASVDTGGNLHTSAVGYVGASVVSGYFGASVPPGAFVGASVAGGLVGASVSNFPTVQQISGYVGASVAGGLVGASVSNTPPVSIASYSVTQPVSVASTAVTQPVSGGVTASVVGYLGASITNANAIGAASQVVVGGSITLASATPGIYIGASISNVPAVAGAASQVIVGGSLTVASMVPGLYLGASIANAGAVGAASQVIVGGSMTIASTVPGIYVGASVPNFPASQQVLGYIGASVANLPATQAVSGYLGASVAGGLLGASVANTPPVAIASYSVTQPVSVASTAVTQPVSGYLGASVPGGYVGASIAGGLTGASVSNFPATQPVSGYLGASVAGGYVGASLAGGYVGASLAGAASIAGGNITPVGGSVAAFAFPNATGGASPFQYVAGASVNQNNVKSSAGTLYGITVVNLASQARYVKLFDKGSTPSPGTDIPAHTYIVPGAPSALVGNEFDHDMSMGMRFAAGIGFATTLGYPTADKTAIGASDLVVNLRYS